MATISAGVKEPIKHMIMIRVSLHVDLINRKELMFARRNLPLLSPERPAPKS